MDVTNFSNQNILSTGWLSELNQAKGAMVRAQSAIITDYANVRSFSTGLEGYTTSVRPSNNGIYLATSPIASGRFSTIAVRPTDSITFQQAQNRLTDTVLGFSNTFNSLTAKPFGITSDTGIRIGHYPLTEEQRQRAEEIKVYDFLLKEGWIVTKYIYANDIFKELTSASKEKLKSLDIEAIYLSFFELNNYSQLGLLIESWYQKNSFFLKRRGVFEDCLYIIRKIGLREKGVQLGRVLIPTLIAQMDGVLCDYAIDIGFRWDKNRIVNPHTTEKLGTTHNNWIEKLHIDDFTFYGCVLFLDYLFLGAFPDAQHTPLPPRRKDDEPENPELARIYNRHKIMHGEILDYGTIENLIRTFLILDFVAHLDYKSGWDAHVKHMAKLSPTP